MDSGWLRWSACLVVVQVMVAAGAVLVGLWLLVSAVLDPLSWQEIGTSAAIVLSCLFFMAGCGVGWLCWLTGSGRRLARAGSPSRLQVAASVTLAGSVTFGVMVFSVRDFVTPPALMALGAPSLVLVVVSSGLIRASRVGPPPRIS
ncbi:hypothetical protein GCM10022263_15030 [Nocardioides daeguensis]|uniref:Uncharacterized protein n=1 Tax=Nocardioides daeguensis TaxID=908359 RepID=A0ABP6V3L7_9ACTN